MVKVAGCPGEDGETVAFWSTSTMAVDPVLRVAAAAGAVPRTPAVSAAATTIQLTRRNNTE